MPNLCFNLPQIMNILYYFYIRNTHWFFLHTVYIQLMNNIFSFFFHRKTLPMTALTHDKSLDVSWKPPWKDQCLVRQRICCFFSLHVYMVLYLLVRSGDLLLHTMLWFNAIYTVGVLKYLCHRKPSIHCMTKSLKWFVMDFLKSRFYLGKGGKKTASREYNEGKVTIS